MAGKLYYWVANWNLSRAQAAILLNHNAADMIDCTSSALARILASGTSCRRFAGYITGSPDIRWTPAQFDQVLGHEAVFMRIDQSNGDLPLLSDIKLTKDVESGASTIATAVRVAGERLRAGDDYTIYVDQADLVALEDAVAADGLPAGQIIGYQYASPTSNPNTVLPGTMVTLADSNADLSVVHTGWLPLPGPVANVGDPSPAHVHSLARVAVYQNETRIGVLELDLRDMHWNVIAGKIALTPLPWGD